MVVVRHPPHVAIAPVRQQLDTRLGEVRLAATAANIRHHALRHYLLAIELAIQAHHLAETGQVAQRGVETTAGECGAHLIGNQVSILLGA
ncbi:hypothetical protein D9M73_284590 [compost metagenome]